MAETKVRDEDIFRLGSEAPGLRDAVFTVATLANDHLITAREMLKNIQAGRDAGHAFEHQEEEGHEYPDPDPDPAKDTTAAQEVARGFGVLMPAVATKLWLERLERVGFDIFNSQLRKREWRLPWKSYWAFRRRMF
jgi:NADH dehydrogenase [ubiquinone] 1 alpha subcomplex assembly factor 6